MGQLAALIHLIAVSSCIYYPRAAEARAEEGLQPCLQRSGSSQVLVGTPPLQRPRGLWPFGGRKAWGMAWRDCTRATCPTRISATECVLQLSRDDFSNALQMQRPLFVGCCVHAVKSFPKARAVWCEKRPQGGSDHVPPIVARCQGDSLRSAVGGKPCHSRRD